MELCRRRVSWKSTSHHSVDCGPKLSRREDEARALWLPNREGNQPARHRQTVVVKGGTVLAVEAFEGTNAAMKRGGELGRKEAVAVKVSKPNQDFRFDVPVIGSPHP